MSVGSKQGRGVRTVGRIAACWLISFHDDDRALHSVLSRAARVRLLAALKQASKQKARVDGRQNVWQNLEISHAFLVGRN